MGCVAQYLAVLVSQNLMPPSVGSIMQVAATFTVQCFIHASNKIHIISWLLWPNARARWDRCVLTYETRGVLECDHNH